MAKKIEKKSDSTAEKETVRRGRPKSEDVKNKEEKPVKAKSKTKEVADENSDAAIIEKIYGSEAPKAVTPFPNSELQTQTRNTINEFAIDISRLPQNVLDAVNALIGDFTYFVSNPQMTNMIPAIMDKDLTATNLLKSWAEPRRSLLMQLKAKTQGDSNSNAPVVLPPVTHGNGQPVTPNPNTTVTVKNPIDQNPNPSQTQGLHGQNNFSPRMPESTYQHNINNPNVAHNPNIIMGGGIGGVNENKNVHYEMLTKANPAIEAQNKAQQNLQYTPPPLDNQTVFQNYAKSVMDIINSTFQMNHWGYIPLDVLQAILNNCDKSYSYEVVVEGEKCYINISSSVGKIQTDSFIAK